MEMPAIGQRELGAPTPEIALLDPVARPLDLEVEGDPRRCPFVCCRLEALDRLRLGAVALEQHGLQGGEQGRLAHLVGADDEVQAVGHAGDPDRAVELAELLELEGAKLHVAASLRCSVYRRRSARAAISRAGPSGSSAMARRRSAATRTKPPWAIASRSSPEGSR